MNAAFIDAEFDEFFSGGVSLAGNAPRNIPETTANLWVNWAPVERWQVGGGLRYVSSRFGNNTNTEELPAYTVVDASLNWDVTEHIALTFRVRNLTDEEDYVLSQYVSDQWIFAEPRAFEFSFKYSM